jgi:hypothetical protein
VGLQTVARLCWLTMCMLSTSNLACDTLCVPEVPIRVRMNSVFESVPMDVYRKLCMAAAPSACSLCARQSTGNVDFLAFLQVLHSTQSCASQGWYLGRAYVHRPACHVLTGFQGGTHDI